MATLNREERLPDRYHAKLRYHSSRPPSQSMVFQLAESLQLARAMSAAATTQITAALDGTTTPAPDEVVRQVLRHHFKADIDSPRAVRDQIISVLTATSTGLAGDVQLSDVLARYRWNLYDVYTNDKTWDEARRELPGLYRKNHPKNENNEEIPWAGYVAVETLEGDNGEVQTWLGSIHIEFSYASVYPRPFLAMAIVHEATHKFADTDDHGGTDHRRYAGLSRRKRIENADSYAYAVLSLHRRQLVPDLRAALQTIPPIDPTSPPRFTRNRAYNI
jgi:hypothetical protein